MKKHNISEDIIFGKNLSESLKEIYGQGLEHKANQMYDQAIDSLKKVIAQEPHFMFPYFVLGQCYVELQDWQNVIEPFEKVNELVDDEGDAYFFVGLASFHLTDYPKAIESIKKAIEIGLKDNRLDTVYYYLAVSEKMNALINSQLPFLTKWDGALQAINKAIDLSPNAFYFIEKGNILVGLNAYTDALELYKNIFDQVKFTHEYGIHAALGMATCYSLLHSYEECLELLQQILAVVPEIKSQMAQDSGFNNLRTSHLAQEFENLLK
jgi:tetratricopeptide (TPR) repeat protein